MLETYNVLLVEITRNFYRNLKDNPFLYFWFSTMLFFSLIMFALLTFFMINNQISFNLIDIVISLFFLFLVKSSADFHRYFNKSPAVSYAFSTQISQKKTFFEIFLVIFWINLGIFVLFSSIYMIFLGGLGIYLNYPLEYIQVLIGIIIGLFLGPIFTLHYFNPNRLRLTPAILIIICFWLFQTIQIIIILLILTIVYFYWSLKYILESYQYITSKKHNQIKLQTKIYKTRTAIFHKETIILWRDRLLLSFIISASLIGAFAGYLNVFGEDLFIPEQLQKISNSFLHSSYGILGIYILVIYTAVFPTINMFFNEENTIWIIRHLPIKEKTLIEGKVLALTLPLIASFPYIWFYSAFTGTEELLFMIWFLLFSFLASVIISLPISVKYVGKKSDILVLYCLSLLVFVIIGIGFGLEKVFTELFNYKLIFYIVTILFELILLSISIWISAKFFSFKYKNNLLTN